MITNMNRPLGYAIGNALEVEEALAVLQDEGPADLKEVCLTLAAEMLSLCNGWSGEEAMKNARTALESGKAYAKMKEWINCQGGDLDTFLADRAALNLPSYEVQSPKSGYISQMDAEGIGISAMLLGAGRAAKTDTLDYDAGIILLKKTGDAVQEGEPIARLYAKDPAKFDGAKTRFLASLAVNDVKPAVQPLIYRKIGGA